MTPLIFIVIIVVHYFGSLFLHSFFLHRYATHQQCTMSRGAEKFFLFLTWLFQGSAHLQPETYARLHLQHHEHSDTEDDPHSPEHTGNVFKMMWQTKNIYDDIKYFKHRANQLYKDRTFPQWKDFQWFSDSTFSLLLMGAVFISFYIFFAPVWWCWLFLPFTLLNGPVQGAIVNWCGHKYGYRNHLISDNSHNTGWFAGLLSMGELYQNNHHANARKPNFGDYWWEIDPTYLGMLFLEWLGLIKLVRS